MLQTVYTKGGIIALQFVFEFITETDVMGTSRLVLLLCGSHQARLVSWVVPSGLLCVIALAAHFSGFIPLNKNLYSSSYILLTGDFSSYSFAPLR
jgi:hypothetical protein